MIPHLRTSVFSLALAWWIAAAPPPAQAALIALDSFETTATTTSGFYLAGNINGQTSTNGTVGYYAGTAVVGEVAGWQSATGAFLAEVGGLTNPLLISPATSNDGSFLAAGNLNPRLQYRDLAARSAPASTDYYFSMLLSESVNSYTGTVYAGIGLSRSANNNGVVPTTGFNIGFNNGALALFYNTGGAAYASESLLATPTANQSFLVEVHLTLAGTTASFTPFVYDHAGTLVNTPALQNVTGVIDSTMDLGAFQSFVSAQFNNSTPSKVVFDEFRFGTAESDVINVPEPGSPGLMAAGGLGAWARGRRRKKV